MIRRLSSPRELGGFAGLDGLYNAYDFEDLAKAAVDRANGLLQGIGKMSPGAEVVGVMDEISDNVCRVADVANFCHCVHPDGRWRQYASGTLYSLVRYIGKLNTDERSFQALKSSLDRRAIDKTGWTDEASIVGESLFRDFVHCGMGSDQRTAIEQWIRQEHARSTEFQKSVAEHKVVNALKVTDDALLAPSLRDRCSAYRGEFYLAMTPQHFNAVMQSTESEDIRKEAHIAHFKSLPTNVDTLTELLRVRHQWANCLGWTSYGNMKLHDAIAGHPNAVFHFLQEAAYSIKPKADAEVRVLEQLKRGPVHQWDLRYLMSIDRMENTDRYRGKAYSEFHLQNVINGISRLLSDFMDIEMLQLESAHVWDDHVQVFELRQRSDGEGDIIGHLYMDLLSRKHKRLVNAHYTLRCGRRTHDGRYITPIVALVANFSSTKLGFFELKTLMHEFGHVLHSLLCKTEYQHLFGTRGPLDMVEVPSHFFEKLVQYPEVLRYLAGVDRSSHKPVSLESLKNLIIVESMYAHLRQQDQLHLAIVDQILHGEEFHAKRWTTSEVMESVQKSIGSVPFVKDTHKEAWLTHLTSYGARYYSYVYSRYIADIAWERLISKDVFNKTHWTFVRKHLFQPGSAVHPQQYVWNLIGRDHLVARHDGWIPKGIS